MTTTNPVSETELRTLAKLEEANRLLELRIIKLKADSGIIIMERELAKNKAMALMVRDNLLERERAFINENGKKYAGPFTDVRSKNHWVYDDSAMIRNLCKLGMREFIRVEPEQYSIKKNDLKAALKLMSFEDTQALEATWVEDYDVQLRPLGELAIEG